MPFPEQADCASPAEYLRQLIEQVVTGMERDPELCHLFLIEGRRIRHDDNSVMLTSSYSAFALQIDGALTAIRDQGQLNSDVPVAAVRSAMMGACEGLLRDQLLAHRRGGDAGYTETDLRCVIDLLLSALIGQTPR